MNNNPLRVLVLGGTRFIGPPAVHRLVAKGCNVTVFHRGQHSAALPDSVQHLHGDLDALPDFAETFRKLAPDVVLHMRAMTQQEGEVFVKTFAGIARRTVVVSSVDVYRARDRFCRAHLGPLDQTPLTEGSPLRDHLFPYAVPKPAPDTFATTYDKILVERAVTHDPALPATILRLPMVYGQGDYQHRFFVYLKRMDDRCPYILLPDDIAHWRAPRGYVEDIGEAIALCVTEERAAGRIYHVGDQPSVTEAECVERIARTVGWKGEIVPLPNPALPSYLQHNYDADQDWSLDASRIRQELGYTEPTPPDVAMQRTLDWERANPPENVDTAEFDYEAETAAVRRAGRNGETHF